MTMDELKAMRPLIDSLAAPDCALFMWATFPTMHTHALPLFEAWGFTYKTAAFVWLKVSRATGQPIIGNGQYTRGNMEPCLIGIRGKPPRKNRDVRQPIIAPRARRRRGQTGHSVKPAQQYKQIERLYEGPYIELFARRQVEGWDVSGMAIDGTDYRRETDDREKCASADRGDRQVVEGDSRQLG